jgi:hypothetical protein
VLWFVSGVAGLGSLSRRRLIANCSSAVLPKREIISRIAGVLDGLSPELKTEFEALMTDRRASLCPMRLTAGIADAIDEGMALRVLEAMKDELAAPAVERAAEAEELLHRRESELARAHEERKDLVLAMQGALAETETQAATAKSSFDEQLAQLRFNLESKDLALDQVRSDREKRQADLEDRILIAKNTLARRERKAKTLIKIAVSVIVAIPSIISILLPGYKSLYIQAVLVCAYLATFKFAEGWLERLAGWLISNLFLSDRRFIAGLEEGRELT